MDDLILGEETNEVETENEAVFTSDMDYITAAYFALAAVQDMDEMQHGKDSITQRRIRRIKRKALIIIDECLKSLYDEIIDETDED